MIVGRNIHSNMLSRETRELEKNPIKQKLHGFKRTNVIKTLDQIIIVELYINFVILIIINSIMFYKCKNIN